MEPPVPCQPYRCPQLLFWSLHNKGEAVYSTMYNYTASTSKCWDSSTRGLPVVVVLSSSRENMPHIYYHSLKKRLVSENPVQPHNLHVQLGTLKIYHYQQLSGQD